MRALSTPRDLADDSVSENHVRSLLLHHKVILSFENFGKLLQKVLYSITIIARKSMKYS